MHNSQVEDIVELGFGGILFLLGNTSRSSKHGSAFGDNVMEDAMSMTGGKIVHCKYLPLSYTKP